MGFKTYQRKVTTGYMRPYVEGEDLTGVSVSDSDREGGLVKEGGFIACNPDNPEDRWYVNPEYFAKVFNPDPVD